MRKREWSVDALRAWPNGVGARPIRAFDFLRALVAAFAILTAQPSRADEGAAPLLGLPLRCDVGETCWIVNYVDLDPSPAVTDYACGKSAYDGHKGTDFAIRDTKTMTLGIPVVASAAGTVIGIRDGERDVDVSAIGREAVKGKECGNGVVVDHGSDWHTQYCHLQRGSLAVKKGDRVEAGQKIGLVGMSGLAEFPHVHLEVRHGKAIVDPFAGIVRQSACGLGPKPLWRPDILARLPYRPTVIYNVGFATTTPHDKAVREGVYADAVLSRKAPLLFLWTEIFRVEAGDLLTLRIVGPQGDTVEEHTSTLEKAQARRMAYVGSKRKKLFWDEGIYRGTVSLVRETKGGKREEHTITRDVAMR